ncbi:SulP family inorganic anion transporter [Sulfitobacter sp. SK011]|uniref:SulP family inorganic anion transporter n=1 Tax=Sulfitobacter sp. SK011 TaxID=1389004 RepID=UPI000E0B20CB|nr:sulfate permease [Sulfitobacter sp. SK011]AXI41392.1 sodium-independent anion transporter [Sulfitobacter sp. SK011]
MAKSRKKSGFRFSHYFPILDWGRSYTAATAVNDLVAALIVTIMLIPQSLAYAMLAGLPPEAGLYASIVPIMLYSIFGTSRSLAVGPVAVVSLMTAAAIADVTRTLDVGYATAALSLAALSGTILMAMGILRLGFIANFLSHPVISGFITASGVLIAASQLKHVMGIDGGGHNLLEIVSSLVTHVLSANLLTVAIGVTAIGFLFWVRKGLRPALIKIGLRPRVADFLAKAGPVFAVGATTWLVWNFDLNASGVQIVGAVPQSLPPFTWPDLSMDLMSALFMPALLISIIGFVESISVAQTLATKKRQRIDPDQELIGLGAANIGASLTGGFPVTGGFSRSVVNFDAGAETPAAGAFTAIGLTVAALFLTPLIYFLPKATLAATIIVAVLSLVDVQTLKRSWIYSKRDFGAVAVTMLLTLGFGVELGVTAGVVLSILLFLYDTSRPHVAEVGLVEGTEHFRNIRRHAVLTDPTVLSLRIDQSLYFANARFLEDYIYDRVIDNTDLTHVVLMCSAVNEIDLSALETLEMVNTRLKEMGIDLSLSEVKGPVMDRLRRGDLLKHLTGNVYLSQFDAFRALAQPKPPLNKISVVAT